MTAASPPRAQHRLWLGGMACGVILAFATPLAMLVAALMAPAALALAADREPGRPGTRAVALFAAAASLAPVWHLMIAGNGLSTALDILAEPTSLATAWMASATAWALCQLAPLLTRLASDAGHARRRASWAEELAALEAEWAGD